MKSKNNFYILTGGPGSGKTTLSELLAELGYRCVAETGRKIIKEQLASGGTALPWKDTAGYSELMLEYSIGDYISLETETDICFFDRGIPDILGYAELIDLPDRKLLIEAVNLFRYNRTVFILPPWQEIYQTDPERKQDFELATTTYRTIKKVYEKYHYKLLEIPCLPVPERVQFILDHIG